MKKSKFLLLGLISAFTLTGCGWLGYLEAIASIIESVINDPHTSVSDEPIVDQDGLYTYTGDGSEFDNYEHDPQSNGTGVNVYYNKVDTYDRVNATTWSNALPSTGSPRVLVVPVKFSDYASLATETIRTDIYKTFFGKTEETGWESVASFYNKSSFGELNINGAVTEWFDCGYTTKQFSNLKSSDSGYDPTWTVLEKAVSWYKTRYNSTGVEFDTNHDGFFDAVWLVYGAPDVTVNSSMNDDYFWAYTYFDTSVLDNIRYQSDIDRLKTNPVGYHYAWASYDFMYEGYGKSRRDAHTYIHETGHLLGLDDYYVAQQSDEYANNYAPLGWVDMMDANVIDHNSFSKFALGWVRPFVPSTDCTIEIKPASTSGEFILLPTVGGWNGMAFDEYILLEYYTPEGLNESDSTNAYANGIRGMTNRGIRILHIDARLIELSKDGYTPKRYVDSFNDSMPVCPANCNTAYYNYVGNGVGSLEHRLIQTIDCTSKKNYDTQADTANGYIANNGTLFTAGKTFSYELYKNSFPNYYFYEENLMNDGTRFPWIVKVESTSNEKAVISLTKA